MSTSSPTPAAVVEQASHKPADYEKVVQHCNFRAAGRLTNEDARSLTVMHDAFARQIEIVLDAYLSTTVDVKLLNVDQLSFKDHLDSAPFFIAPISLGILPGHILVECDRNLVFPMLELLMGGNGRPREEDGDLSEIDEEIMHDVVELIGDEVETVWHIPDLSVNVNRRIKPALLHRYCVPTEKLTVLRFGVRFADATGSFSFVLSTIFLNALLKQIKLDQPQRKRVWHFPTASIRERILDCDLMVNAELPGLKVAVRDLVALQAGSVLKLRAPIQTPGMLTAGGRPIFEAIPVRNGSQRAAQLGRRTSQPDWKKGDQKNG